MSVEAAVKEAFNRNEHAFHYEAEPTLGMFHRSDAFIRGIRGPFGSGKSVACVAEIAMRGIQQEPDRRGVRRTRWAAVRATYPELRATTIDTFLAWFGAEVVHMNWTPPISGTVKLDLQDGTTLEIVVFFVSCDRPSDADKLKSWDLTGVWLNEASELDKSVLDMATSRVGRFPLKKDGAPFTWAGVIMDTNSMDDDHWWYILDCGSTDPEEEAERQKTMESLREALERIGWKRELIEFFDQPAALIEEAGGYRPNPLAENVRHQPMGMAYWLQLAAGKDKDWIAIHILNQYGKVIDGKPVYPEYNDQMHGVKRSLYPIAGKPITLGLDFGLSPAAIPMQYTPRGQLLVFGELCAKDRSMGLKQFLRDALRPYLADRFGTSALYKVKCDPAGKERAQGDDTVTCFQILSGDSWDYEGAKTNSFIARREAVGWFLGHVVEGQPALLMDESCKMLRKGFRGGYHYRRVQVSGEARYQDEPYKNKYSHPHDALQYGCLDWATLESPAQGANMLPDWQRRLRGKMGAGNRPWRVRGGRA